MHRPQDLGTHTLDVRDYILLNLNLCAITKRNSVSLLINIFEFLRK